MAEARDEHDGTAQDHVLGVVPRRRDNVRHLVAVRSHRSNDEGDTLGRPRVAVLDEADRRRDRIHRRTRLHVRAV